LNIDQIVFVYRHKFTDKVYAASVDSEPTARTFENDENMEHIETINAIEYIVNSYKTGANKDTLRLDWLSDKSQSIGNVQLPTECVERNLDSLRGAIDDAMLL